MSGLSPFALGFLAPIAIAIFGIGGIIGLFLIIVNLPEPVLDAALMVVAAGLAALFLGALIGSGAAMAAGQWDSGTCGPFDDVDTCEGGHFTNAGHNIIFGSIASSYLLILGLFGYQFYQTRKENAADSQGANNAA